jgi:hypothetical protein
MNTKDFTHDLLFVGAVATTTYFFPTSITAFGKLALQMMKKPPFVFQGIQ